MPTRALLPYVLPPTGRSGRSYVQRVVPPGESTVLADVDGPGCLQHLFFTMPPKHLRACVLRFYWDHEEAPSVVCPAADFFGLGHHFDTAELHSIFFYIATRFGFNCYVPMPFSEHARVTLTNESEEAIAGIFCSISFQTYETLDVPWRFHAAWRRELPTLRRAAPYLMLEARGRGRLLGAMLHVCRRDDDDRWTHGGAEQLFIDGDSGSPAYVYGVGGEDYAHQAWGLYPGEGPYSGAHIVHPVSRPKPHEGPGAFELHGWEQFNNGRYSMYRFFIPDPILFDSSLRMTFGCTANEISSVAYWYQIEPHCAFICLPPPERRSFGSRLRFAETCRPLTFANSLPVAVLGPMQHADPLVWSPADGLDLSADYDSDVQQPFGDIVIPPWRIHWRRTQLDAGFLDLQAVHRPKSLLAQRGLWHARNLPTNILSHQLIAFRLDTPRELCLRLGFEDTVYVAVDGDQVGVLVRPDPKPWQTQDLPLSLTAGPHRIVISATQERDCRWSVWAIYVALLDADGRPVDDLEFDDFEALPETPQYWREPDPLPADPAAANYRDPLHMR